METFALVSRKVLPFVTPQNADKAILIGVIMASFGIVMLIVLEIVKRKRYRK